MLPLLLACLLAPQDPGLAELYRARSHESLQWSSYDRSGRNSDHGHFERELENGAMLIGHALGPGRLVRLWSAQPKGVLTLRDGERVLYEGPFARIFDGDVAPFAGPLTGHAGGGYLSRQPVAFEHGLVATLRPESPGGDIDCYYQFGIERHAALPNANTSELLAGYREHNDDRRIVLEKKTLWEDATLATIPGPAVLRELRIRMRDGAGPWQARELRGTSVEITWDGAEQPAIRAPLGDFFGIGPGGAAIDTVPVGSVGDARYVRFPMPFAKSATIRLCKDTKLMGVPEFDASITYRPLPAWPEDARWFHARWVHERTQAGRPVRVASVQGAGHFVGLFGVMESGARHLFFLEGDESIHIDGELRFRGTGTEDWFDGAWYFRTGTFAAPFHALALKDEIEGRVTLARWHVPDPIPFARSFVFDLEHGGENDSPDHAYGLLACFYLDRPDGEGRPLPPVPERLYLPGRGPIVLEGEELDRGAFWWSPPGRCLEFSGGGVARVPAGAKARMTLPVPAGRYLLSAQFVAQPEAARGILRVLGREQAFAIPAGEPLALRCVDLALPATVAGARALLELEVREGHAALDTVRFERWEERLRDWQLCGPFPSPARAGFEAAFGPERGEEPPYPVLGAGERAWFAPRQEPRASGYVDLNAEFAPNDEVVAYARTTIQSEREREATLVLGSDDGIKVWLNGELVHQNKVLRGAHPEQDRVPVRLRAGANLLLLKIEEIRGGWGFYATLR